MNDWNYRSYAPESGVITTDLIGELLWDDGMEEWVTVRAMWRESVTGMMFLVENTAGELMETLYSNLSTKEPRE